MSDAAQDRETVCYQQNFQQMRSLNTQMNHVPALAMTLTGGLWFGAGVTEHLDIEIRFALLIFAGLCNIALILTVLRIRDVIESYLEKIKEYSPESFADSKPKKPKLPWLQDYSMILTYAALMFCGAALSFIGAFWKYWPIPEFPRWVGLSASFVILLILYFSVFRRDRKHGT